MKRFLLICVFAASAAAPVAAQQLPASPAPVPVTLDPRTTVLLVLDVAESPRNAQPKRVALLPRIAALLAAARRAGAFVLHSSADPSGIAPAPAFVGAPGAAAAVAPGPPLRPAAPPGE